MQLSFDVSQYFNKVFKWIYLYTSLILFLLYKDIYNKEAIQCYIGVIVLITRACNYTCMFFFRWVSLINFLLSFIPILSVLQSQRDIHEHIGGGFFLLSLSALNMWSCQQHRYYLWYLVRDFFFLDLDDKIVSAPLITHRYRDLGRAPYRTGRSQQVSSPEIL